MLLKALLLKRLYSVRSEAQLVEDIRMNLLYRWFLDLSQDAPVWDATSFTKNRERFEKHGLLRTFFDRVVEEGYLEQWMSEEHFSMDGTLIQSYASMKSLLPIDTADERVSDGAEDDDPGNPTLNFRGEKRTNQTHRSLVDPEARLARKANGQPSMLSHAMHLMSENRNGLIVDVEVTEADGHAERDAALCMMRRARKQYELSIATLGADKGYDASDFMLAVEDEGVTSMIPVREGVIRNARRKLMRAGARADARERRGTGYRNAAGN